MNFDCPLCGTGCTMRADKKRNPFYSCACGQHFLRGVKGLEAARNCIGQAKLDELLAAPGETPAAGPAKKKPARRKAAAKKPSGAPSMPAPPKRAAAPEHEPEPAPAPEPEPARRRTLLG